jgi:hypothetical protein
MRHCNQRSPAIRKLTRTLVVVTAFAALAFTAQSVAACDWNRQASTEQPTTAAALPPQQTPQAASAATQTSTTAAETTRKAVEEAAPVVLASDHRQAFAVSSP